MDEHSMLTALRQFWIDGWVAPLSNGVTRSVFADDQYTEATADTSVRTAITTQAGVRLGVGRQREEVRGMVAIEFRTPRQQGTGLGERLSTSAAALWRTFRHSRIRLDAPSVVGLSAEGAFNRHLLTLGWRGDLRPAP